MKFGSEAWVLKKREEQRLKAAQMKFLRYLLGITQPDKEKNQCIREKTGAENTVKEIKQYQEKWLQHIQRVKIVINDNIIEQVTDFKYLGYRISEFKSDLEDKLQTYNKINGAIR